MNKFFVVMIMLLICMQLFAEDLNADKQVGTQGNLLLKVYVIENLNLKPVLLTSFKLISVVDNTKVKVVRTDETGKIECTLEPGKYNLVNVNPLTYNNYVYNWNLPVEIVANEKTEMTITSDDAEVTKVETENNGRQLDKAAELYQELKKGVVTVESDLSHGSGFIISDKLIVTNFHVIEGNNRHAIKYKRGLKVKATVLAYDKDNDFAILTADLSTFPDIKPVNIYKPGSRDVIALEGEKVFAIGSPINQEKILTTGIVSKVEERAIISDVNINPGNSGGPLFNYAGEVIAINTFLNQRENGPGISGSIRLDKLYPLIKEAELNLSNLDKLPSGDLLPDYPLESYPIDALYNVINEKKERSSIFDKKIDDFDVEFQTPLIIYSQNHWFEKRIKAMLSKKKKDAKDNRVMESPLKTWMEYGANVLLPIVSINIIPIAKENFWSAFGNVMVGTKVKLEFRDSFDKLELYRDDNLVEAIQGGRSNAFYDWENYGYYLYDGTYSGKYFYDYNLFEPSKTLRFRVYSERRGAKYQEFTMSKKQQQQIYDDFKPCIAARL